MEANLIGLPNLFLDQKLRCKTPSFLGYLIDNKLPKLRKIKPFYVWDLSLARRKNPFRAVRCSSADQGLKPKPRPLTPITENTIPSEPDSVDTKKPAPQGMCDQIEKLVSFERYGEALELFEILQSMACDALGAETYVSLVDACVSLRSGRTAKLVFRHMIDAGFEFDQHMRNRVLLMHLRCGMISDARRLFDEMPERNMVSWNTMVSELVDLGSYDEAFDMFLVIWPEVPDVGSHMFATIIRASAGLGSPFTGRQLHSCVLKVGLYGQTYVSCALIDMYSKCGCIEEGQWVFDDMPKKTTVAWNTIIAGYALHGYSEEALDLCDEMRSSRVEMDHFTYSIIIRVCTRIGSLEYAKQAHAGLVVNGFGLDIVANTALVDFYSKWGRIEDARHVFDKMPCKNVITWNALIGGYANHGMGNEAVEMLERMSKEHMVPNHVTFLAALGACSYSGLLDKGKELFDSMSRDHKLKPRAMHYACIIEMLGREGLLDEAFALINNAPFRPTTNMWAALLMACRVHKNLELGKFAAEKLCGMEPTKLSNYIVLLNIYEASGRVDDAARVLETLQRRGLRLVPACSWIEIKKQPQKFFFGDKSHPHSMEICKRLEALMQEVAKLGYVPEDRSLLPDVTEHEQLVSIYHSEMLAIVYGLISTPDSTPLRVLQGHRICNDCHIKIKLITTVTNREIVVRDGNRFHHFKCGTCSCKDYW